MIGVDRLDYSKGLIQRLDAFGIFLANHSEWLGKLTYLQITPTNRTEIPEYSELQAALESAAGRINGKYGEVSWTPIRYVNRVHSRSVLAGLYRTARVGLVTPLRDGMNLVAQEYVAAQDPDDPGVLILSRFVGAAINFRRSVLVNPYDAELPSLRRQTRMHLTQIDFLRSDGQHKKAEFRDSKAVGGTQPTALPSSPVRAVF